MLTAELEKIAIKEAAKQGLVDQTIVPIYNRNNELGSIKFTFDMISGGECVVILETDTGVVEDIDVG